MIEGVLSLLLLVSAGPGGADSVAPGDPLYGLDRALEAAMMDGVLTEDEAIALQTNFADERIFEAEMLAGRGDTAGVETALNEYDGELGDLLDMTASYEGDNPDGVVQGLDETLQSHDRRLAALEHNPTLQDGDDGGEGDNQDGDTGDGDAGGDGTNNAACSRTDHPVVTRLVEEYADSGLTYEQVVAWFCAEGEARYGFGEISMSLRLADASGHPVDEIMAMRDSGMGWGQIKQELGIHGSANGNGHGNGNANGHGNGNGNGNGNGHGNGNGNGHGNGGGDDDEATAEPTEQSSGE